MGIYTTPTQLRVAQRRRFDRVLGDMQAVHREMATGGFKDFLQATSGRISTKQLALMGHPFAVNTFISARSARARWRAGEMVAMGLSSARKGQISKRGMVRDLPINKQSGELRRGIKLQGPSGPGSDFRLFSDAPHAKYVLRPRGTSTMRGRGLLGPDAPSGGYGLLRKRHTARSAALVDVVRKSQRKP